MEGEVIAAGPGSRGDDGKLHPLDVKVGDRVLFGKWSGTEIKIDGEDFVVAKESDIMGVVEEAASQKAACREETMAAKEVRFHTDARERMLRGIDILSNAVRVTLGPKGRNVVLDKSFRGTAHQQGWRHRRQGDRARGQVREHGRADGARGGLENE